MGNCRAAARVFHPPAEACQVPAELAISQHRVTNAVVHTPPTRPSGVSAEHAIGKCRTATIIVHSATSVFLRQIPAEGAVAQDWVAVLMVVDTPPVHPNGVSSELTIGQGRAAVSIIHPTTPPPCRIAGERTVQ